MIRKFLTCGPHTYLSSKKTVVEGGTTIVAEVLMPLETFIEIRDMLEQTDYMMSANENQTDIQEIYRRVYKKAAPYAVMEKDRSLLYARAKSGPPP